MEMQRNNTTETAAIYLRLSRDDGNSAESESIGSQRMYLQQYADAHGFVIDAEFTDDGISGMQRERPGLNALLHAANSGWIHTVLVKDLSRLSRDYILTGELLERYFPSHGIRLISVNDGIDTAEACQADDFSPLRAVMNDWYARDISRKVRAAIYARQRAGICTSAALPYGYQRVEKKIVPANEKADVVAMIFTSYASGKSCTAIRDMLNAKQIPSPSQSERGWNDAEIGRILRNPAYIGQLVLHKTRKLNYKCAYKIHLPYEETVLCEIPPIINNALFDCVQEKLAVNSHRGFGRSWLSGKVFCDECGSRMTVRAEGKGIRLLCGGKRQRNGCRNPSVTWSEIRSMLTEAGLPADDNILCRLIQHITVAEISVTVSLICSNFITVNGI